MLLNFRYLEEVSIPASVIKINAYAFTSCHSLRAVEIEEGSVLQEIGVNAFRYCRALESIAIPDAVKLIDGGAFLSCSSLKSVTFTQKKSPGEGGIYGVCLL